MIDCGEEVGAISEMAGMCVSVNSQDMGLLMGSATSLDGCSDCVIVGEGVGFYLLPPEIFPAEDPVHFCTGD